MSSSKAELPPAIKAHIMRRLPLNLREAYYSAASKSMLGAASQTIPEYTPMEIQALETVENACNRAKRHRRIQGLTPVRR